ncbi:MAG TPA: universal stress protein [Solirubrobacteraceae bacterium]|jgi:nucleotide-binding universal stress UspA family protein|nr:universal stress protein [Solirubrobacteraceae bacterium]
MFEKVIVGVDGRPTGRDAIALAARLLTAGGGLTLVHVRPGELRPVHAVTPGLLAVEREASHELLERERDAADLDPALQTELLSLVGISPGRALHDLAEERSADLLVVGSCGHGLFGRAVLGDTTRAALNGAPCAVAVAARGYADHPLPLGRIGVGYDGSGESEVALAAARELAGRLRATVSALQVVSIQTFAFTGIAPPILGESIELMVKEANARMAELEGVEGRAVYGLPGEELAAFGDQVDLLVVGSRGYGPLRRLVLGSTSDYLERHARSSLLVLPRTAARGSVLVCSLGAAPRLASGDGGDAVDIRGRAQGDQ